MPQLRQNIITGDWVVIAPERAKRPNAFHQTEELRPDDPGNCVFCLQSDEYKTKSIKEFETDLTYVLPNKYPAFLEDKENCSHRTRKIENGFYPARVSTGGHDLIVIKEHNNSLFHFSLEQWKDFLQVSRRRYKYWRQDCNSEYSMLIYNQGRRAGASIHHPHAQLFASNILPNLINRELRGSRRYFENEGECVFCALLRHEEQEKIRMLGENEHFSAFCFYAARFPFEVWILPKMHSNHFEDAETEVISALAKICRQLTQMYDLTLKEPSLNFFIHDLPRSIGKSDSYHWHLEFAPRVSSYGGYEMGSGVVIDVMSPEDAAKYMKGNNG